MKNIQVSDELYKELMIISERMVGQNHLCTAMPYFWTIKEEEQVSSDDDSGQFLVMDEDGDTTGLGSDSKESEFHKYIREMDIKSEYTEWRKDNFCTGKADMEELTEFLEEACGCYRWYYQTIDTYKNSFFTYGACLDHIKSNNYHYNNPTPYLFHAWRNPEMEVIQRLICEISGGKLHT